MPLKFIYLNSPTMGKEKWHKAKFEKSKKNDSIEFRKNKTWQNENQILNPQIAKI